MLASQMCTSVSITRSSGIACSLLVNVAAITRSFNMFSATTRSSSGTVSGAAPRSRFALIARHVFGLRREVGHASHLSRRRYMSTKLLIKTNIDSVDSLSIFVS